MVFSGSRPGQEVSRRWQALPKMPPGVMPRRVTDNVLRRQHFVPKGRFVLVMIAFGSDWGTHVRMKYLSTPSSLEKETLILANDLN